MKTIEIEIALAEIPERAGLFVVEWEKSNRAGEKYLKVNVEKKASENKDAIKWNDKEIRNLARLGTMRILGLKQKLAKSNNSKKNEN